MNSAEAKNNVLLRPFCFRIRFLPVEKATLAYILITTVYLFVFFNKLEFPMIHFTSRFIVAALIILLASYDTIRRKPLVRLVRTFLPFALLSYWYPETYYYNDFIFPNLDPYFVAADQAWFGCQPSLKFSEYMPQAWFSELMYFGYFSYYFIFFGTTVWCWIKHREITDKAVFIFIGSFYLFYIVFIILPVVGPQFYFPSPLNEVPDGYLFCEIMRFLQSTGEKPTGAFPSSHIGITFTVLIFMGRHCRELLKFALPLFVLLILSTVYIKAHYLVDVVGGFAFVAITYPLVNWLYKLTAKANTVVGH